MRQLACREAFLRPRKQQTADAFFGGSLFLPAAGNRWDGELNNAGSNGNYWSSSLITDSPSNAWGLYFDSGDTDVRNSYYRGYGFSVRPVLEN